MSRGLSPLFKHISFLELLSFGEKEVSLYGSLGEGCVMRKCVQGAWRQNVSLEKTPGQEGAAPQKSGKGCREVLLRRQRLLRRMPFVHLLVVLAAAPGRYL